MDPDLFRIRPYQDSDEPLIMSSWIHSARGIHGVRAWRRMPHPAYQRMVRALIAKRRADSDLRVACYVQDPDFVVGWACVEGTTCHYVYVLQDFRGLGIARALTSGCSRYSLKTRHKKPEGWEFDET